MMFFNVVPQKRLSPATEANIETKVAIYSQGLHQDARDQGYPAFMLDYFVENHRTNLQNQALLELEEQEQREVATRRPRG